MYQFDVAVNQIAMKSSSFSSSEIKYHQNKISMKCSDYFESLIQVHPKEM